ncbi:MAG: hypothetical protein AB7L84_09170 [Acidimicrobiia bacterium]
MTLHPLDQGWTPIDAFVLIKVIDGDGQSTWAYRTTGDLNREELLGVLLVHAELIRQQLAADWEED